MVWRDTEWNGIHMTGRQRSLFDYNHNSIYASIVVIRCNCVNYDNRVIVVSSYMLEDRTQSLVYS